MRTISPKRGNYLPCFVFLLLWVLPLGEEGCKIYLSLFINILGMTRQNRFREFSESCKMRGGVTNKPSTRQKSPKEMRRGNQRFEKVSKVKNILLTSHTSPMASKEWYLYQYLKELVYIICWFKTYKWHWKSRSCHLLGKASQYLGSSSDVGKE